MDQTKSLRQQVYCLLIVVAAAVAVGRIMSAERLYEPSRAVPPGAQADGRYQVWPEKQPRPMPTFGSNDRSRWDTVRALVDEETFAIGRRDPGRVSDQNPYGDYGIAFEDGWTTVDKVLNPVETKGPDGKAVREYYSSKPPLPAVLMAGQYWVLKHVCGWSFNQHPWQVVRLGLITFNGLPFLFYLWMITRLAERYGATDWGRMFMAAAAAFGTLLNPFLITFNNHTLAAFAALAVLYSALPVAFPEASEGRPHGIALRLFAAGVAAGLLFNFELPGAAFVAAFGLLLLIRSPLRTLLCFLPPVLLLVAAYFLLNHLATGQWMPVYEKIDTPWYQYPGSIWATIHTGSEGSGIEFAKYTESRWMYAFHLLFGHHGWFSLTPVNLLGAAGMIVAVIGLVRRRTFGRAWDVTVATSATVSLVVFVFYAFVVETANYGGWTNGPRWLLWLTPLWLFALLPAADWLGRRRWGRILCFVMLALSVVSASYTDWNAWRHPWIYNWMESNGWLPY